MALTREQIIQNIEAMEKQGASQPEIQEYVNHISGSSAQPTEQTKPKKTFGQKVANTTDAIFGGKQIGTAFGTAAARAKTKRGTDIISPDYSQLTPEAKARLEAKGVPTSRDAQLQETADTIKGPTAKQIVGDVARVATNFIPVGKGAELASAGIRALPKIVRPAVGTARVAGNVIAGAATGAGIDAADDLARGDKVNVGAGTAIGAAIPLAGPILKGAGNIVRETLGRTTFAGAGNLKQVIAATRKGGEQAKAVGDAINGRVTEQETVDKARNAFHSVIDNRSKKYQEDLSKIANVDTPVDHTPVLGAFDRNLKKFGVKQAEDGSYDFSRAPGMEQYKPRIDKLLDVLKNWGSQEGDNTIVGIDKMKQVMEDFEVGTQDALKYDSFVNSLKKEAKGLITDQIGKAHGPEVVKNYQSLLKNYENSTNDIKEIDRLMGLGDGKSADLAYNKLSKIFRNNNGIRERLVQELNQSSGGTLVPELAGRAFSEYLPGPIRTSFAGAGAISGAAGGINFLPIVAGLASLSPKIVGQLGRALGFTLRQKDALEKVIFGANGAVSPGDVIVNRIKKKVSLPKKK